MKKYLAYILITVFCFLTIIQSKIIYDSFQEHNIPVYDGVTYEKKQIEQFERFKGNFSLWKKNTEKNYQLMMNGVDGGYVTFLIYIAPKWLANDYDVLVRSFISLLIFSFSIFHYLARIHSNDYIRLGLIFLFLQFPLFYSERYGLSTYITEIPSAMLLLSGYIQFSLFRKNEKIVNLLAGVLLMIIPVYFRLNFIVYSFFFILPFIYVIIKFLIYNDWKIRIKVILFLSLILIIILNYFLLYKDYFINYYINPDIKWEGHGNLINSLKSFFIDYFNQIGWIGAFLILIILVSFKKINKVSWSSFYNFYPFIVIFSLIILINKYVAISHVISAITIFSFLFLIGLLNNIIISSKKIIAFSFYIFIIFGFISFFTKYNKVSKTLDYFEPSVLTEKYIFTKENNNSVKNYICLYNDVAETPIDVKLYRRTHRYLNSQNHFFYHDYGWFHKIDKSLDSNVCFDYLKNNFETKKIDLVVLNEKVDQELLKFPLALSIWKKLNHYFRNQNKYKIDHIEETELYGKLYFYRPI